MDKLIIAIDGNSLCYRAYFAMSQLTAKDGTPTGALHGFFDMLLKLLERKPDYLTVAFDEHAPTFRHGFYPEYKAGRPPTPDDLRSQIAELRELLPKMGVHCLSLASYEADDILGTIARMGDEAGCSVILATGDRDALQLVSSNTSVVINHTGMSDVTVYTPALVEEKFGLPPEKMVELKALMGDSSDNIPGIPGVGPKTALKLLNEYGSLDGVLEHAAEIKGKLGEKVQGGAELARLSLRLGTIDRNVPLGITLDDLAFDPESLGEGRERLRGLELNRIAERLPRGRQVRNAETAHVTELENLSPIRELLKNKPKELAIVFGPLPSFAFSGDESFRVKPAETLFDEFVSWEDCLLLLSEYAKVNDCEILSFGAKAVLQKLFGDRPETAKIGFDAQLADYLLSANRPASGFEALCREWLHTDECSAADLFALKRRMLPELERNELTALYSEVELPLTFVLYDMEQVGFCVDKDVLLSLHEEFALQAEGLKAEIYELAGEEFSILSPKQLGVILFEKLGLPKGKKTKTGYSTDADTLEGLKELNPIVEKVLEYRFIAKLDSTFVVGLLNKRGEDGRIHSSFMQFVAATGRISSTEPNLQNIPVRTAQGREIRKAFVPSEGNVLIDADYSQIELRLLAHISGDERFIDAFNSGEDIHKRTAAEVFHVPLDEVTREQRSAAKAVNFGIVYGISDFGLARNLNIPVKQAKYYIERYFLRYPGVKAYLENSVRTAKELGYCETLFHRKRPMPELASGNYVTRSFGERVAMNMPIQGSAADVIKIAMVRVHKALKDGGYGAKLVLQVHDELIIDAPRSEADEVYKLLERIMSDVASMKVRLEVDVKEGESWYETK